MGGRRGRLCLRESCFCSNTGNWLICLCVGFPWGGEKNKLIQGDKSICWGWILAASVTLQFIENGLVGLQELAAGQKLSLLQQVDFRSVDLCCLLQLASRPANLGDMNLCGVLSSPLMQVHFPVCLWEAKNDTRSFCLSRLP